MGENAFRKLNNRYLKYTKMRQTTKIRLAKEIVIFFLSIALIILVWSILWVNNNYNINKTITLQNKVLKLTNEIDSIKSTFPNKEDTCEFLINKDTVDVAVKNIHLFIKNYPTAKPISREFRNKSISSQPSIITFLVEKDTYDIPISDVEEFTKVCPKAILLPPPPLHDTWVFYEKLRNENEKLKSELSRTLTKIYSPSNMIVNKKWICIIILTLIYPFRLIVLSLLWALKTLRQKP
jgi:hypothetical protein